MTDMEKTIYQLEKTAAFLQRFGFGGFENIRDAIELLKDQKEIVRCENCRHAEVSPSGLIKCRNIFRSKEWFCADGMRKEEE